MPGSKAAAKSGFLAAQMLLVLATFIAACGSAGESAGPPVVARSTTPEPASTEPPTPSPSPTADPPADQQACNAATVQTSLRPVDKEHALPSDYEPEDLVAIQTEWLTPAAGVAIQMDAPALEELLEMLAAARTAGHEIRIRSAYRSFTEQVATFDFWVQQLGLEQAERESARAGHSEHQLGTTVDLSSASVGWELVPEFGSTPEGQWLATHAVDFGFALSYPEGAEEITGYVYEPWHLRYLGRTCATAWAESGLTVGEFLSTVQAGAHDQLP